uniref:SH3 domain-binding protein 5 homolog n=1 Tax=Clastoptera arizonana TaxID=38151 RepID=A0A1B6CLU2_9HEMI
MTSAKSESDDKNDLKEDDLDPRIKIELEKLNTATDEINTIEIEFDEAQKTFNILMNERKRRHQLWSKKLGSSMDRARPYFEALEIAKNARSECQRAAFEFQRAYEFHRAARETAALAETRYLSQQHVWQFDTAWQESLNQATKKVAEAEHNKAESGREHQRKATLFNAAEQKVQILEQRLKKHIIKSRPYFEEMVLCQSQLEAQSNRVKELQAAVLKAKSQYASSLRQLEAISEEIHLSRKNKSGSVSPSGPREPGVGAELALILPIEIPHSQDEGACGDSYNAGISKLNLTYDLEAYDSQSLGSMSRATSAAQSDAEELDEANEKDLEELRVWKEELSHSNFTPDPIWETELTATINRLDALHTSQSEEQVKSKDA